MRALIDADSIMYKYASINQDVVEWEEGIASVFTSLRDAKDGVERHIQTIIRNSGAKGRPLLILSPAKNFRYDVLSTYKHNRKPSAHPLELIMPLKKWLYEQYNTHVPCYVEADDYCVWRMLDEPRKWVLCHIDKDLDQADGKHYNYNTERKYSITEREAEFKFYDQTLTGDTSDGYKGCPSIGTKRSALILNDKEDKRSMWERVKDTYISRGLKEEDALQQARVARMLTPDEWDGDCNIKLWRPYD
jgi:DNA polymerase-1